MARNEKDPLDNHWYEIWRQFHRARGDVCRARREVLEFLAEQSGLPIPQDMIVGSAKAKVLSLQREGFFNYLLAMGDIFAEQEQRERKSKVVK